MSINSSRGSIYKSYILNLDECCSVLLPEFIFIDLSPDLSYMTCDILKKETRKVIIRHIEQKDLFFPFGFQVSLV